MNINDILKKQGLSDNTLLLINKHDLDTECQHHSELFRIIGDLCAEYESRKDEAKSYLAEVEGRLCERIRATATEKTTDTRVLQAVKSEQEYRTALNSYLDNKELFLKLENRKESLQQRSYMISNLCELFKGNYFSNITVKENTNEKKKGISSEHLSLRSKVRQQEV